MHEQVSFSAKEIAARNGFSLSTVSKHIREGRLKAFRVGGIGPLRITAEQEALWLRGQHEAGDPEAIGITPERAQSLAARRRGK